MATIKLNHGRAALVDDDCVEMLLSYKWRDAKLGAYSNTFYAATSVKADDGSRKLILMHRLILGLTDRSVVVDHINRNGLDNRRCNLRACTQAENSRNRRVSRNNSTGHSGVFMRRGNRFVAYIGGTIGRVWIGSYKTLDEAVQARADYASALFGDFAP